MDPFVDPNEPMHVGYSSVYLKPLSVGIQTEDDYAIYHDSKQEGIMHVKIEPCNPDGSIINEDEEGPYDDIEEPKHWLGRRMDLLVTVQHCRGLNSKFSSEVYVEYDFPKAPNPNREDGRWQTTKQRGTINPNFGFTQQLTYEKVDEQILHRLENESAYFHVYGLQEEKGTGGLQKKKLLSLAEIDALQVELRAANSHQQTQVEVMSKIQQISLEAARSKEASESFILELANSLAEAGLDVQNLVEAAPLARNGGGGSSAVTDSAKVAELEAKDENIKMLQQKIAELEASSKAAMTGATFVLSLTSPP